MKKYAAAGKERAVTRAVESEQPMAQTARDRGVQAQTLPTGMGPEPRVERQEQEGHDAHLDEARKRLRKANARVQEERDSCTKATADVAPPRPSRPPGGHRRTPRARGVACVSFWRLRIPREGCH